MDACKLTIRVTENYQNTIQEFKKREDVRKCRCWFDILAPVDGMADVILDESGITVCCRGQKGIVTEHCGYDSVRSVTELRNGIMLRLSKTRLLLLPVQADARHNEQLMQAFLRLGQNCRYMFKRQNLWLSRVPLGKQLPFYFQKRHGHRSVAAMGSFVKIFFALLVFACLFVGTVFVSMPWHEQKIDRQDAQAQTIVLDRYEAIRPVWGRHRNVRYVWLYATDGSRYEIDNTCWRDDLREALVALPKDAQLQLLLRPDGDDVLEIAADGKVLLAFDDAQQWRYNEALAFLGLGICMYVACGVLVWQILRKKI